MIRNGHWMLLMAVKNTSLYYFTLSYLSIYKPAFSQQAIINISMGSTPSSQLQAENGNVVYQSTQGRPGNIKESLKLLNKKPKMALEESNPEQMGEQQEDEEEAPVKKTSTKRDERNKHDDRIDAPIMGAPLDFEALARSNIPKSAFDDEHSEEEEENQQDYNRNRQPEPRRLNARTKPIPDNVKHEQQLTHERTKMRHPPKHPQEADYLHNSSILTKPHKPHHPAHEEIDIHQFNSAHIRHKAIQEVHMQEHPLRPIKQQEPAYQHQQLYPKILKNYHKETPTHQKHQEDPHEQKINVFKRHRPGFHQETQQEEEAVPISHPNFKIHKADKDLQRSMDLRGRHEEQQLREPKTQRQPVPNNADFRKRKYSHPPQPLQKQSRSIQQEEEKSIAQLNRQNQFGVTQYQADPAQLITCRQGCGRKFLANRIKKHEAICRDVFQKKRKEFNAQEKRIVSKQQRKLMKQNIHKERQQGKQEDIPKWKAMSIALRAHVKMGKDQNYRPTHEEAEMLSQEQHIDVVNCEFCGRNFNKNAAKSHIPFCKGQYQKMIQKERMQRPNRRH